MWSAPRELNTSKSCCVCFWHMESKYDAMLVRYMISVSLNSANKHLMVQANLTIPPPTWYLPHHLSAQHSSNSDDQDLMLPFIRRCEIHVCISSPFRFWKNNCINQKLQTCLAPDTQAKGILSYEYAYSIHSVPSKGTPKSAQKSIMIATALIKASLGILSWAECPWLNCICILSDLVDNAPLSTHCWATKWIGRLSKLPFFLSRLLIWPGLFFHSQVEDSYPNIGCQVFVSHSESDCQKYRKTRSSKLNNLEVLLCCIRKPMPLMQHSHVSNGVHRKHPCCFSHADKCTNGCHKTLSTSHDASDCMQNASCRFQWIWQLRYMQCHTSRSNEEVASKSSGLTSMQCRYWILLYLRMDFAWLKRLEAEFDGLASAVKPATLQ